MRSVYKHLFIFCPIEIQYMQLVMPDMRNILSEVVLMKNNSKIFPFLLVRLRRTRSVERRSGPTLKRCPSLNGY